MSPCRLAVQISLLSAVGFIQTAWGDSSFEHDHHGHEPKAHVHGEANLQINRQTHILNINFSLPAMDVLGFEHKPDTTDERAQLDAMVNYLNQPSHWLELPAAAVCSLKVSQLKHPYNPASEQGATHKSHNHNHDHDHKSTHTEAETAHGDFSLAAQWNCAQADQLNRVTITLFRKLPRLQQVNVEWISDNTAGVSQAKAAEPNVLLGRPQ